MSILFKWLVAKNIDDWLICKGYGV